MIRREWIANILSCLESDAEAQVLLMVKPNSKAAAQKAWAKELCLRSLTLERIRMESLFILESATCERNLQTRHRHLLDTIANNKQGELDRDDVLLRLQKDWNRNAQALLIRDRDDATRQLTKGWEALNRTLSIQDSDLCKSFHRRWQDRFYPLLEDAVKREWQVLLSNCTVMDSLQVEHPSMLTAGQPPQKDSLLDTLRVAALYEKTWSFGNKWDSRWRLGRKKQLVAERRDLTNRIGHQLTIQNDIGTYSGSSRLAYMAVTSSPFQIITLADFRAELQGRRE